MVRETRSRARKSGTETPQTPVTETSALFSAQASIKSTTPATSDIMDEDDDDALPVVTRGRGRAKREEDEEGKGKQVLGKRQRAYIDVPSLKSVAKKVSRVMSCLSLFTWFEIS
jgi:hypothetical protein